MDVVRIAQEEHVLMKKNGFIQFKSGDWCVCVGCFIFASIQMNKHDLYQIQLRIGSILRPHPPLSVRALTLQERKLAFVLFPFIIEETKDCTGPPSGSNGKSNSCEVTVFSPR
ncbi:hypothetical protein MRB53_002253 [Persea americana]|uniref:Uncharacterized protein n=1 Tax=Persea americana TaxID=3435 RepID=A0ACC2MU81_PERAE|nr:hypothetical protein MRB53_002253 [Persea americana]